MKILAHIIMASVTLVACSREMDYLPKNSFTMTVEVGEPATKTAVADNGQGGFSVSWQADDRMAVYEVPTTGNPTIFTSEALGDEGIATGRFTFQLEGTPEGPFTYQYVYPASAMKKEADHLTATLPQAQTFAANSFDPKADVLVSRLLQISIRPSSIQAGLARLGGTAKMTIQAPATVETVQKVIFSTTGTDVYIAGSYDLSTQEMLPEGKSQVITLTPAVTITYTGNFDVWFRLAEVTLDQNFTVSVVTDKKTYTKTLYLSTLGRSLEFRNSALTTFGVDMTTVSGVENERTDVLDAPFTGVTSTSYANWSNKTGSSSNAVYAGRTGTRSPGGEIGLNTSYNDSGIITTTSGGRLKSVTIAINNYGRSVEIYAKNSAYTSASDLFDLEKQGTLVGTVAAPSNQTGTYTETIYITGNFTYVGIRSKKDAINLAEARIVWDCSPAPAVTTNEPYDITDSSAELTGSYISAPGGIYEAGFYWGESEDNLSHKVTVTGPYSSVSGNFSCQLTGLEEYTAYFVKAYVKWLNTDTNTYEEQEGEVTTFSTALKNYNGVMWLELPGYSTDDMNGTSPSSFTDLYYVSHSAEMDGTNQRNYTILYDPETYTSYFVAYPICARHMSTGRKDSWGVFDPIVPKEKQVNLAKGYGVDGGTNNYYARGHQIPNADRSGVTEMQKQTYYPTNMTPQLHHRFNENIWANLEAGVRSAVPADDTLYVVTGAAFRKKGGYEGITYIQPNNSLYYSNPISIPVPNYYWKVLLKVKRSGNSITSASAIGFWLEHNDEYSTASDAYIPYATSVDQIEAWTGFDFFKNLPTALQNACEDDSDWEAFKNF